jgi:large subunit ribosomal protein L4
MATFDVTDLNNQKVGTVDLDDRVFAAPLRKYLLSEIVHWQRAKARRGTQSTLTKGEVHGTTKKPYKQKGTGNARQGDMKNPHMVGGGVAFAPKPRSYDYAMPKGKRRAALAVAISARASEQRLRIVKDFSLSEAKTKNVAAVVKALSADGSDSALIVDGENEGLKRSAKNLASARYLDDAGLNVHDILGHRTLIMTESAAKRISDRLTGEGEE